MKFTRKLTSADQPIADQIEWEIRKASIPGAGFTMSGVEVPKHWSQTATNILAQKYLRKAGVPNRTEPWTDNDCPSLPRWLMRSKPGLFDDLSFGPETSAKQVFHRMVGCWTYWGWHEGYFDEEASARAFYDELYWMLANQYAAPNSPQWFNCFSGRETFVTKEYGTVSLAEVAGESVTVWTRKGWKQAEIHCFGPQRLMRVTFRPVYYKDDNYRPGWTAGKTNMRVTIDVTPNHRWPLLEGGETTNLTVHHIVDSSKVLIDRKSLDYREGFKHGVIFGDGNFVRAFKDGIRRRYRARLCGDKKWMAWAFDRVGYPDCFAGDPLVQTVSSINLKEFPSNTCDQDYIGGFIDGWTGTDGNERSASTRLSTRRSDAESWLRDNAAAAGWTLTGLSIDNFPGGYNIENMPMYILTLTQEKRGWRVVEIEYLDELEEVFCAVVPDNQEFTLSSGIVTGNCGLHWAYGIEGPDSGQWCLDVAWKTANVSAKDSGKLADMSIKPRRNYNSYERPQIHACFIQPVADTLVGEGGMLDLWAKEARLFKGGSGTGTNFSTVRGKGENLSGGGKSSGLMSFLRVGDSNAGSIKSGGVTRRAAKMIVLDPDHPEIENFVDWKVNEECKAAAMHVGSQVLRNHYLGVGDLTNDPTVSVPGAIFDRMAQGFEPQILKVDGMEAEAIASVDGQNSNNSVRIPDEFLHCVDKRWPWRLLRRTDGELHRSVQADELWNRICRAAWACGDPGLQFSDTMNAWHTCKADGEIRSTNPCGEYNFLDNTACNLASLNLCKFLGDEFSTDFARVEKRLEDTHLHGKYPYYSRPVFNCELFKHAVRLWTAVLDISVSMASYPSREIAQGSYNYRTLGLGYANLGGLLARLSLHYDSVIGRDLATSITALLHFAAYRASNELANELGTFPRYEANQEPMRRVLDKHDGALDEIGARREDCNILLSAVKVFNEIRKNYLHGFRNAQVTLLAPTGTIALLMDCDTTGIEPYFSPQSTKQLAGGGTMSFEFAVPESECANGLSPEAHIKMVAAVQPFLSGGVSKTVNLPHSATIEDVSHAYRLAHSLGLKSISIYRDGSKLTQPLASTSKASPSYDKACLLRGEREPLPPRRRGYTHKLRVGDQAIYLHMGEYSGTERRLGELFIDLSREGSTVRSLVEGFAKAISIGLQFGVPLSEFVDAFVFTKFDPAGPVQGDDRIKFCSSLMDLIFRYLGVEYLGRDDLAHIPGPDAAQAIAKIAEEIRPKLTRISVAAPPLVMTGNATSPPIDACKICGSYSLRRTGTCIMCDNCGADSGCG